MASPESVQRLACSFTGLHLPVRRLAGRTGPEDGWVVERVTVDDEEVGDAAFADSAEVGAAEEVGIDGGSGSQGGRPRAGSPRGSLVFVL